MPFDTRKRNTILLALLIPIAAIVGGIISWSNQLHITQHEINIEGSSTVFKIVENSSLIFSQTHPNVSVTVQSTDSSSGINALIAGLIDIAMSSRAVSELENQSANYNLKSISIAKDVLAIIVNENAAIFNASNDNLRAIFNGTITDWSHAAVAAAGLSGTIQVVVREIGSGSRNFFNEYIMGDIKQELPGSSYSFSAIEKQSNQLLLDAVAHNQNYIGYLGLGFIREGVKVIGVNNISASIETVKDGSYPLQRELVFITNGFPQELMIREFINWSLSPIGQQIVQEVGFVPIVSIISKFD